DLPGVAAHPVRWLGGRQRPGRLLQVHRRPALALDGEVVEGVPVVVDRGQVPGDLAAAAVEDDRRGLVVHAAAGAVREPQEVSGFEQNAAVGGGGLLQ